MKVKVYVYLKKGVLDPQGKAVLSTLHSLKYNEFTDVRVGKFFEIQIDKNITDRDLIEQKVKEIAEKVLSNPIIESYSYEIVED